MGAQHGVVERVAAVQLCLRQLLGALLTLLTSPTPTFRITVIPTTKETCTTSGRGCRRELELCDF